MSKVENYCPGPLREADCFEGSYFVWQSPCAQKKRHPLRLISYTLNLNPAIREVIAKIFAQWAVSLNEVEQTGSLRQWLAEHGLGVEEPGAEEDEPVMMEAEPVAEPEGADDLMAELLAEMQD